MKPLVPPPPDPVAKSVRMTALVVAGYLVGVHLALAEERYNEDARYVGALFVLGALGLAVGAGIAAAGRKFGSLAWMAWVLDVVIVVGMFASFLLSRSVGLPGYHRHDWPVIQVIALFAETAYVALFLVALGQKGSAQKRSAAGSSQPSGHSAYGGDGRARTEDAAVHRGP
jgi:hypothetical protein